MIPELQTQYDTLKKFEETYQSHISALLEAKQELLAVKENEADKRAIIEKKIGVLESSIKDLKREKQEITGITGPISLGINTGLRNSSVVAGITGCNKCGRLFSYSPASVSVLGSTLCPDCSRNI